MQHFHQDSTDRDCLTISSIKATVAAEENYILLSRHVGSTMSRQAFSKTRSITGKYFILALS